MKEGNTQVNWPSPEATECPYPFYEQIRHETPVFKVPGTNHYLVSRYEDIVWVSRHPEIFSSNAQSFTHEKIMGERGARPMDVEKLEVSETDPPLHTAKRALMSRPFAPSRLGQYEPIIRGIADELIDSFIERGEVEFVTAFAAQLPLSVMNTILGLPHEDWPKLADWATADGLSTIYEGGLQLSESQRRSISGREYIASVLQSRYEHPGDDVLSEIIQAQVNRDGFFDQPYLTSEVYNLWFAGNVTTTHAFGTMMGLLLEHPETVVRIRADNGLLKKVIEEALRLESPAQFLVRLATVDTKIGGTPIPAGSLLLLMYGSGNRDEAAFENPNQFDPDRLRTKAHIAFGSGIHTCLGAPLARLELKVGFEQLLTRLKNLRPDRNQNDFRHLPKVEFRALKQLHIEFEPESVVPRS